MRIKILIIITLISGTVVAQTQQFERKGFIFGLGLGGGTLSLSAADNSNTSSTKFSASLPNVKVGYMVTNRLAVITSMLVSTYKYDSKDRGFEGLIIGCQYWVKDKWWLLAGAGLTIDAPAFYTVKDPKKANFYSGIPAISLGTGYEIWRKNKFALDIQYRAFYGKSNLPNGHHEGISNMIILGFNWY